MSLVLTVPVACSWPAHCASLSLVTSAALAPTVLPWEHSRGVLGHAKVRAVVRGARQDGARHVHEAAAHGRRLAALRRNVLGRGRVVGLPARLPQHLAVGERLPVARQRLVADRGRHVRDGRGLDHKVGVGAIDKVVPHEHARAVVGRHVHALHGRGRRHVRQLDVVGRDRVHDVVVGRAGTLHAKLRRCGAGGHLLVHGLHREQADVRERDVLRAAQLLVRRDGRRGVLGRALEHVGRVEGAVLQAHLHRGGARTGAVLADEVDHVAGRRQALDGARLVISGVRVVDEAHPERAEVLVVLREEVELLVLRLEGRAHGDARARAHVAERGRHLPKAHGLRAVCVGVHRLARHVDAAGLVVVPREQRRRLPRDHVARGHVRDRVNRVPVRLHVHRARRGVVVLDAALLPDALAARDRDGQAVVPVVGRGARRREVLARALQELRRGGGELRRGGRHGAAAERARGRDHAAVPLDVHARLGGALRLRARVGRGLRVEGRRRRRVERAHLEVRDHELLASRLALDALVRLVHAGVGVLDEEALLVLGALVHGARDLAVAVGGQGRDGGRRGGRGHAGRGVDRVDLERRLGNPTCRRVAVREVADNVVLAVGRVDRDAGDDRLLRRGSRVDLVEPHRAPVLGELGDERVLAVVDAEVNRRSRGSAGTSWARVKVETVKVRPMRSRSPRPCSQCQCY